MYEGASTFNSQSAAVPLSSTGFEFTRRGGPVKLDVAESNSLDFVAPGFSPAGVDLEVPPSVAPPSRSHSQSRQAFAFESLAMALLLHRLKPVLPVFRNVAAWQGFRDRKLGLECRRARIHYQLNR